MKRTWSSRACCRADGLHAGHPQPQRQEQHADPVDARQAARALRRASTRRSRWRADLPENYEANPQTFQFIKDVAVDWDDTRMLAGEVGDLAVFARKARGSAEWFLGAVGDEQERRFDVALDFLAAWPPLSRGNLPRRRRCGLSHQPTLHRDRAAQRSLRRSVRYANCAGRRCRDPVRADPVNSFISAASAGSSWRDRRPCSRSYGP